MNNKTTNNNNSNNNNISPQSSPTRSRQEREIEQRHQRHHILLMKSNKMLKRCCCYMLILCLTVLLPTYVAAVDSLVVTTDAPPPKRLTTSAEVIQLPHGFRHEEHYSHRIEQAVNDFKRAQLQQLKERDKYDKNQTTNSPLSRPTSIDNGNGNSKNRNDLFQWQLEPHHRRHEQHYIQHNEQQRLPEHHLRHSNARFKTGEENINLPPMRHQRHQMHQQQQQQHQQNHFPIFNNHALTYNENKMPNNQQRLSFQLKTDSFGQDFDESSAFNDNVDDDDDSVDGVSNSAEGDDSSDSSDESDDDAYSYEDDTDESTFVNSFPSSRSSSSYSAIDGKAASVKRYTNPFKNFKASIDTSKKRWNVLVEQREHKKHKFQEIDDSSSNANDGDINDNDNKNDDDSTNFTNEEWHKIKSEHHRRQLQHQREMQALLLRNNPAHDATQRIQQGRQLLNEDLLDADNVLSRNYIPGTLTRQKIKELGTAEAVQESRRALDIKHKKNRDLAKAHIKQINSEAACRIPQRRVERIQLDPAKIYTPHCTILHRCADDTGCCRSERQTCAPKRTQSVDLYFFVKNMNERTPTIERLTFINHTECHCVERSQRQPDEFHNSFTALSAKHETNLKHATILNCNCPNLFERILQEDGNCRCDCSSGNSGCDWLKRGMEHFSMKDRKCVLEGRCKPPTCEYGTYIKKHGCCPKREEQLAYTLGGSGSSSSLALTSNSLHH